MSSVPSRSARRRARVAAASPAVAGFRPAGAALAVATAFAVHAGSLQAQSVPIGAVHGSATYQRNGNNLLVTTSNGAGTSHSAINWQSFTVPGGSTTYFQQPSAASTSINRVLGSDPSAIFGTLGSNGKLVLVNPAGIAVGRGALVDTAGFTASTLGMSDADAIAGRLRFSGEGAGVLQVDGKVLARGGDVVLIGSKVQAGGEAVVQADGAVVLAAGQKAEITGRGLEGIRLEVQAGNEAVNLGTLKGDAVGMFANTLTHSGLVQAQAVTSEGGKVVLQATGGDALVSGTVTASSVGGKGGSIDVLGERVGLFAGAALEASGETGGGQVRVGGDYQGQNADVPNARRVYVDATARIEADATTQGDGGRVILWSDEVTRMHGQISARGGAQGGNGGFAEVSGKQSLEYTGRADLRAPQGAMGTLLLDPQDITIVSGTASSTSGTFPIVSGPGAAFEPTNSNGSVTLADGHLNAQLGSSHVIVKTDPTVSDGSTGGQITVDAAAVINWNSGSDLALQADKGITVNGRIQAGTGTFGTSGLYLQARNGSITDGGGSGILQVPELHASATNGSVLLNGNHTVGTLSGSVAGTGTNFEFHDTQALTVGSVATAWGSGTGVSARTVDLRSGDDLSIDAPVTGGAGGSVTAIAGRYLGVNSAINSQGGSVKLAGGTLASEGAVYISSTGTVASANGQIEIESQKSDVGGTSLAVNGLVNAGSGAITVKAQSIDVAGAGAIKRSGPGDVTLITDGLNLTGASGNAIESVGGRVVVNPLTVAGSPGVALVGAGGIALDGGLNLAAAEMNKILARTLVIGGGTLPLSISLNGNITLTGVQELSLITAANITQSGSLTVAGLNLDAASVTALGANQVQTLSGRYDDQFKFRSDLALTIGTVDGITGVQMVSPTSASPTLEIGSLGRLTVGADVGGSVMNLQGDTLAVSNNALVKAVGTAGGLQMTATGDGVNDLGGGKLQSDTHVNVRGNGSFTLGNVKSQSLNLFGGTAATASSFQQRSGTVVEAAGLFGSLNSAGSLVQLANPANKIGSISLNVLGDLDVTSSTAMSVAFVEGNNVVLEANGLGSQTESSIFAAGSLLLLGTTAASSIDLSTAYIEAGSLDFDAGGSVRLTGPNLIGYVSGTAGGDVAVNGLRGVGSAGVAAGGSISLTATTPPLAALSGGQLLAAAVPTSSGDLDLLGSVSAGGAVALASPTRIVVQDTAHVSGSSLAMNAPTTEVYGLLKPGGAGGIGSASVAGDLFIGGAGSVQMDVASLTSFDTLDVTGVASTDSAAALQLVDGTGGSATGSFSPTSLGAGSSLSFKLPATHWSVSASQPYLVTIGTPPVVAPAPPPPTGLEEQVAAHQGLNQVVTFATLFLQEAEAQQQQEAQERGIGKDDIVITETACK